MSNDIVPSTLELQMSISDTQNWYNQFVEFTKEILKENLDFGKIPGSSKPTLLKPGAEKLKVAFNLQSEMSCIEKLIDLDHNYIDYTYKCTIKSPRGQSLAQCEGSCNSHEIKYKYNWVIQNYKPSKADADQMKAKKLGKWIKLDGDFKWQTREINTEVLNIKNTLQKMAQKRAFVGAILMATGASEFFTQDIEDLEIIQVDMPKSTPEFEEPIKPPVNANFKIINDKIRNLANLSNKSIKFTLDYWLNFYGVDHISKLAPKQIKNLISCLDREIDRKQPSDLPDIAEVLNNIIEVTPA